MSPTYLGIGPKIEQFLKVLSQTKNHENTKLKWRDVIAKFPTAHSLVIFVKSWRFGNCICSPLKSDILLKTIMHMRTSAIAGSTRDVCTYNCDMFFNWDIVGGIGPSIDVPWMSLQKVSWYLLLNIMYDNNFLLFLKFRILPGEEYSINIYNYKMHTYNLSILVQFPIKSGMVPDMLVPSILLQTDERVKCMKPVKCSFNIFLLTSLSCS